MNKLSFLTRTSLLLSFFFALDKLLAFGKTLLFNRIVGLDGMVFSARQTTSLIIFQRCSLEVH